MKVAKAAANPQKQPVIKCSPHFFFFFSADESKTLRESLTTVIECTLAPANTRWIQGDDNCLQLIKVFSGPIKLWRSAQRVWRHNTDWRRRRRGRGTSPCCRICLSCSLIPLWLMWDQLPRRLSALISSCCVDIQVSEERVQLRQPQAVRICVACSKHLLCLLCVGYGNTISRLLLILLSGPRC